MHHSFILLILAQLLVVVEGRMAPTAHNQLRRIPDHELTMEIAKSLSSLQLFSARQ